MHLRVNTMLPSHTIAILALGFALFASRVSAATCTTLGPGNFNNPAIWSCGVVPSSGDVININHFVTLNQNLTLNTGTLNINAGGSLVQDGTVRTLIIGSNTGSAPRAFLNVNGTLTVGVLQVLKSPAVIAAAGTLTVTCTFDNSNNGDITVSGYFLVEGGWNLANGNLDIDGTGVMEVLGCTHATGAGPWNGINVDICLRSLQPDYVPTGETCDNCPSTGAGYPNPAASQAICSVLPVNWVTFDAFYEAEQHAVRLHWTTHNETNNSHFIIQRSTDAQSFFDIGQQNGIGTSPYTQNYSFSDPDAFPGVHYYRLRQVDYDGRFSYSPTRQVRVEATPNANPVLLASQVVSPTHLNVALSQLDGEPVTLRVLALDSRVVATHTLTGYQGTASAVLEWPTALAPGHYVLQWQSGHHQRAERFWVQGL